MALAFILATGCTPAPSAPPPHNEEAPHHVGQPDDPDAPEKA